MATPGHESLLPPYGQIWVNPGSTKMLTDTLILLRLLLLLASRVVSFILHNFTFPCFLTFFCESCFTLTWLLCLCSRWTPTTVTTSPPSSPTGVGNGASGGGYVLTTAGPVLEPPIITANTVLSLLGLDYPCHKLACYVSDDGCSSLSFYALVEACKFAELWVPFCEKHDVKGRAPFT